MNLIRLLTWCRCSLSSFVVAATLFRVIIMYLALCMIAIWWYRARSDVSRSLDIFFLFFRIVRLFVCYPNNLTLYLNSPDNCLYLHVTCFAICLQRILFVFDILLASSTFRPMNDEREENTRESIQKPFLRMPTVHEMMWHSRTDNHQLTNWRT